MEKDIDLALSYERMAEDLYLAHIFSESRVQDLEEAKGYFRLAAQYGVGEIRAEALCNLALMTEDPQAKLALYMEAVDENCAHAMNMVGVCIERYGVGEGKALDWYRKAARVGSPCAMYNWALQTRHPQVKFQLLERAAREYEHPASIELLAKLLAEEKAALRAAGRAFLVEAPLDLFLEEAKPWAGRPAAIVYLPMLTLGMTVLLVHRAAQELEQAVLLLTDYWHNESCLWYVGLDLEDGGLIRAMDNPYVLCKFESAGGFVNGTIRRENRDAFCTAVEKALKETTP